VCATNNPTTKVLAHVYDQSAEQSLEEDLSFLELSTIKESHYDTPDKYNSHQIRNLLKDWDLTVLPIVSPTARFIAEKYDYCNRKNIHSVDVNRNYPIHFGDSDADSFSGTKPLSEPESRIVASLLEKTHPKLFISVHSGGRMLLTSPAYRTITDNEVPRFLKDALIKIHNICDDCQQGPASSVLFYTAGGCSMDFAFENGFDGKDLSAPHYAFTFETYAADIHSNRTSQAFEEAQSSLKEIASGQRHCLAQFNPPPNSYTPTVDKWNKALFSTLHAIHAGA
jgi:hypothetical protein